MSIDRALAGWLCAWVEFVRRHARATVALCLVLTVAAGVYASARIGLDSNTIELFPERLPARVNHDSFVALFPDLENALLVVVDADTPERALDAAEALQTALSADAENFEDVYLPGGGRFFERNALLYSSVDELDAFADQLSLVQPVVAELERDGSIANMATLLQTGLREIAAEGAQNALWSDILDQVGRASREVYGEQPRPVSWEEVLLRGSSIEVVTRRVVVVHPMLDFSQALPAAAPLAAIRAAAEELQLVPERHVRVRITGNPALSHEEALGLLWDVGVAGLFCLAIVFGILFLALRSRRLVVAAAATLLAGLVWTLAFAAGAVGNLNVISVSAGVLFLGLGVDFSIHLGMRYADCLRSGRDHARALRDATASVGGSLVLCAVTTSIGFFAFLPTDYKGVAELGLITGVGLLLIAFLTLTLFPALLSSLLRIDATRFEGTTLRFGEAQSKALTRFLSQHARSVCVVSAVVAVGGLALLPATRFEANIVGMRDPSTESVQTFNDLLADAGASSPWYANSVVADLARADALKREMAALDVVERAITLTDYIPDEQEEKLEILADVAFLFDTPGPGAPPAKLSPAEQVEALRALNDFLGELPQSTSDPLLSKSILGLREQLGAFLARVERDPDPRAALGDLETLLLSNLPERMARLRRGLETTGVTRADLPERLVRRMMVDDGRARVQVFPSENLENDAAFARFVDAVQEVDPRTTGVSVNLVEFARTTRQAFREALTSAILAISAVLWLLWRNWRDPLLVLAPLSLAAVSTGAMMVLLGIPLNFFNVVVIPLLLGAGVDSGIHLVERSRSDGLGAAGLLGTTTARAVFFSALTTITSFGTLAFSSHVGLSGLGALLSVGMVLTVICNLVVLPALLALRHKGLVPR